jgi:hypothetical protein
MFSMFQCDMENVKVESRVLSEFCRNNQIVNWFETSAKNNTNIGKYIINNLINQQILFQICVIHIKILHYKY